MVNNVAQNLLCDFKQIYQDLHIPISVMRGEFIFRLSPFFDFATSTFCDVNSKLFSQSVLLTTYVRSLLFYAIYNIHTYVIVWPKFQINQHQYECILRSICWYCGSIFYLSFLIIYGDDVKLENRLLLLENIHINIVRIYLQIIKIELKILQKLPRHQLANQMTIALTCIPKDG